jgi:hypothetical protein
MTLRSAAMRASLRVGAEGFDRQPRRLGVIHLLDPRPKLAAHPNRQA